MELTLSELIDRLVTTNIKCFMTQDKMMELQSAIHPHDLQHVARLAIETQRLNKKRATLMQEIDKAINSITGRTDEFDGRKTY